MIQCAIVLVNKCTGVHQSSRNFHWCISLEFLARWHIKLGISCWQRPYDKGGRILERIKHVVYSVQNLQDVSAPIGPTSVVQIEPTILSSIPPGPPERQLHPHSVLCGAPQAVCS